MRQEMKGLSTALDAQHKHVLYTRPHVHPLLVDKATNLREKDAMHKQVCSTTLASHSRHSTWPNATVLQVLEELEKMPKSINRQVRSRMRIRL